MHNIQCMCTVVKDSHGGFHSKPRGSVLIKSTKIRWFSGQSDGRLDLVRGGQRHSKYKLAQGRSSGSSPLRLDGSRDGQAGWTSDTTYHALATFHKSKAYNLLKVSFFNIEESFILRYA
jgi:hypothetical protein